MKRPWHVHKWEPTSHAIFVNKWTEIPVRTMIYIQCTTCGKPSEIKAANRGMSEREILNFINRRYPTPTEWVLTNKEGTCKSS